MTFREHLRQVAIAIDQVGNTLLGGFADETLSSRLYRNGERYWYARAGRWALDLLLSPRLRNHCHRAYCSEVERRHFPPCFWEK